MKNIIVSLVILFTFFLFSCGESAKEKAQRKIIDSLESTNAEISMNYEDLQEYLSIIAEGLDSISIEEHELLSNNTPSENIGFNRQRMKQNLNHVREILARQRERITNLESKLENNESYTHSLRKIIVALRQQLESKDRELTKLKKDLDNNRQSLTILTSQVQQINEERENQAQTIQEQKETIDRQTQQIYKGYVIIATKKELKSSGLLTGGFLKKSHIDYSKIDLNQFQIIDIRTYKSTYLPEKYKIISTVPAGSYNIEKLSDSNILHIIDPDKFWSVSKFLIIQIN